MPAVTGNAVHQSTKRGLISAENLLDPSGNNALYQALPAVQDATQQMLHNIMSQLPFMVTTVLSLP
jgi:hypothetical protein